MKKFPSNVNFTPHGFLWNGMHDSEMNTREMTLVSREHPLISFGTSRPFSRESVIFGDIACEMDENDMKPENIGMNMGENSMNKLKLPVNIG